MKPAADSPSPDLPASAVEAVAADWLARREAGLGVEEQAEFSRWLLADSRHADVVKQLEASWRFLQKPRFTGQAEAVERAVAARVAAGQRFRRRFIVGCALGGLAAAAALVLALPPAKPGHAPAGPVLASATVAVKPERRTLPDGSVVEFNAGAEIAIHFTPERRDVQLLRGEAHFAVAKNAARPFVVTAGAVSVRAVGTAFDVRFAPEAVGVLVTEGRVAVERAGATAPMAAAAGPAEPKPVYLGVGEHVTVPNAVLAATPVAPSRVSEAEMTAALAWRGLRVEFTNTPLGEAVELFNRQNRVQLVLGDEGLADIRLSGIFWSDDPEGFSRLLESIASLRATRAADTRIVLHR
jgi:transmembrane sensor